MKINRDLVARTFHILQYADCPVRWGARKGDRMEGSYAVNAAELADFAEAYADWDFYVQLNPSAKIGGRRVSAEDVCAWRWFFVDVDPPVGKEMERQYDTAYAVDVALRGYLGKLNLPIVVHSGRGVQLWYALDMKKRALDLEAEITTVGPDPGEGGFGGVTVVATISRRRAVPIAQNYWLGRLRTALDPKLGVVDGFPDLPRLARCPGTINQKTKEMAKFIGESAGNTNHENDLPHRLISFTPNREYLTGSFVQRPGPVPEGTPWQAAVPYLTKRAAAFLTQGQDEPGRHDSAAHAARCLAEAGYGDMAIYDALTTAGQLCRPVIDDHQYIDRTAREAVARQTRANT